MKFFKHKHLFDVSNYPKDSKSFDPTNKKFIDKMKGESKGWIIDEFVGLKSKMHSMKVSCFDDKRFVLSNGINTLAYFHKYLKKQTHTVDHK